MLPQNPTHPNLYAQVALNLEQAADSSGSFVMTQIAGSCSRASESVSLEWLPTGSVLPIQGPYFENQCPSNYNLGTDQARLAWSSLRWHQPCQNRTVQTAIETRRAFTLT